MSDNLDSRRRGRAHEPNDETGGSCNQEDLSNLNSLYEQQMDSYARERSAVFQWRDVVTDSTNMAQAPQRVLKPGEGRNFETRGINTTVQALH